MLTSSTALPVETTIALVLVVGGPLLAAILYLVDRRRGGGEVSIVGRP